MIILGLTGSIGMGKTTTAGLFAKEGIPVFDADETVHHLYQNNEAIIEAIDTLLPGVKIKGKIDRQKLARLMRGEKEKLFALEKIVHPAVEKARKTWLQKTETAGHKMVLYDIPLLFETGGETRVDKVIVVSAPRETQKQRVLSRAGMTEERLAHILSRQMPDKEKRNRADYIIDTSKGLEDAAQQVQSILQQLADKAQADTGSALKGNNVP